VSEEVPSEIPIEALNKTSREVSNKSEADSDQERPDVGSENGAEEKNRNWN